MRLELPPELETIVEEAVRSGRYASAIDVVREAFTLLDEQEARFQALKREIERGMASPHAPLEPDFFADVKRRGREELAKLRSAP
jgi:putative addiction module CopG family antidote